MAEAQPGNLTRNPRLDQVEFIRHMSDSIAAMTQKEANPMTTGGNCHTDKESTYVFEFDHYIDDGVVRTKNGRNRTQLQIDYPVGNEQPENFITPEQLNVQTFLNEVYVDGDNENVIPKAFDIESFPVERGERPGSVKSFKMNKRCPPSPTPSAPEMRMAQDSENRGPDTRHTPNEAGQQMIADKNELLNRLFRALSEDSVPENRQRENKVFKDDLSSSLPNGDQMNALPLTKGDNLKHEVDPLNDNHADQASPSFSNQELLREDVLKRAGTRTPTLNRHVRHPSGQSTKDLIDDFNKSLLGTTRRNLNDRFTEVKSEFDRIPTPPNTFDVYKRHISKMPKENIETKSLSPSRNKLSRNSSRDRISRSSSRNTLSRNSSPDRTRPPTLNFQNRPMDNDENRLAAREGSNFPTRLMNHMNSRPRAEQNFGSPTRPLKYFVEKGSTRSTFQSKSNHRHGQALESPACSRRGSQSENNYDMSDFNHFLEDKRVHRDIRREMRVSISTIKQDIRNLTDRISNNAIDSKKAHTTLSSRIKQLTVQTELSEKIYKETLESYSENHNALVKEIQAYKEEMKRNDLKHKEQLSLLNKICGNSDSKVNSISLQFDTLHKEIQQLNRQSLERTRELEINFHRLENKLIDNREQNNCEFAKLQKFIHDSLIEAKKQSTFEYPSQCIPDMLSARQEIKPEVRPEIPRQRTPSQDEGSVAPQNSHEEYRPGAEAENERYGEDNENIHRQQNQAGFHPGHGPNGRNNMFGDRRPDAHRHAPPRGPNRNHENDLLKNLPRLAKYSGEVPWTDFINQFDKMARLSRWDFAIEMDMLHLHLTGAALHYFENLPPDVKNDPYRIRGAMAERFGPDLPAEAQRSAFNSLEKKDKESLRDFADRVRETAIQAYPNLRANYDESFMVPAFLRGLGYPDACMYNMNQNHRTLDNALRGVQLYLENEKAIYGRRSKSSNRVNKTELEKELSWDPELERHVNTLQRSRSPSNRPMNSNNNSPENGQTSNLKLFTEALNQFKELFGEFKEIRAQDKKERKEAVAAAAAAQKKPQSTRNSPGNSPGKFICYACQEPGHMARECPKAIENSLNDNVTA